ncbi:hypothetical protein AX16_003043 [Volvariella volvacea WC 439]|nr:hypothetical protein AX16_003043 [Volvariella volvacea WC 439]
MADYPSYNHSTIQVPIPTPLAPSLTAYHPPFLQTAYPTSPSSSARSRRRTLSLISTFSSTSSNAPLDISKTTPSVVLTVRPERYDAMGSFAPTASATASLRYLVSSKSRRKQLKPLWLDTTDTPSPSGPPSPIIPSISRTASPPYVISPSPSHANLPPAEASDYQRSSGGMNPILASLERKSKLCANQVQCATCKKWGRDYPRCGKCNLMWCSRECRLVGGKRHVCQSPAA